MIVPAGSAADGTDAESGEAAKIFRGGGGSRKFDCRGGSGKRFERKRSNVGAGEASDDVEAVLGSELLNKAAHFAVTHDGEGKAHSENAPVVRS